MLGSLPRDTIIRDCPSVCIRFEALWIASQGRGAKTRKVYSGELCPDHCNVIVLGDVLTRARKAECNVLLVETAGLCLRCSPYVDGGLGIIVLEATSGMNLPLKVGPMLHPELRSL